MQHEKDTLALDFIPQETMLVFSRLKEVRPYNSYLMGTFVGANRI